MIFLYTHIQINRLCTLCPEVSKAVIFNCLLAANINIEGISPVSNNFVRESNSAQSLMSHPFFHQHSHPPGKLDRLISDNAHTLKLVHICTLHTLHVLLYITFHNSTYLEDKNYNMSTKDLNTKLVLCYLPRIVNCQEIG